MGNAVGARAGQQEVRARVLVAWKALEGMTALYKCTTYLLTYLLTVDDLHIEFVILTEYCNDCHVCVRVCWCVSVADVKKVVLESRCEAVTCCYTIASMTGYAPAGSVPL